ncbi:MAG: hypothetical protein KatS3mg113_0494 [Planctomycetaceae bacterium]|nr:MAG: hypothetical protein KatS3mg113_0494 [Planctomycetaceae bacterium]
MTIKIRCEHCGVALNIKDELAGTIGRCPKCKGKFRIPQPQSVAEMPSAANSSVAPDLTQALPAETAAEESMVPAASTSSESDHAVEQRSLQPDAELFEPATAATAVAPQPSSPGASASNSPASGSVVSSSSTVPQSIEHLLYGPIWISKPASESTGATSPVPAKSTVSAPALVPAQPQGESPAVATARPTPQVSQDSQHVPALAPGASSEVASSDARTRASVLDEDHDPSDEEVGYRLAQTPTSSTSDSSTELFSLSDSDDELETEAGLTDLSSSDSQAELEAPIFRLTPDDEEEPAPPPRRSTREPSRPATKLRALENEEDEKPAATRASRSVKESAGTRGSATTTAAAAANVWDRAFATRQMQKALKESAKNPQPDKEETGIDWIATFQEFGVKGIGGLAGCILLGLLIYWLVDQTMGGGLKLPELGYVSGTVTLDGQPLQGAIVYFAPTQATYPDGKQAPARTSIGVTDQQGRYTMMYYEKTPGVATGMCLVWIDMPTIEGRLRIPPEYREGSMQMREVKKGRQTIDFTLQSPLGM